MSLLAAARVNDTFTHTPLPGQILKVAATIGTGLLVGLAIGAAAVFIVGTGGLGAVILGAVVGAVIGAGVNAVVSNFLGADSLEDYLSEKAGELIDSFIPGQVKGSITTGSGNVAINGRDAARAAGIPAPPLPEGVEPQSIADRFTPEGNDEVACTDHPSPDGEYLAEGSSSVFINGHPAARIKDLTTCDGKINTGSPNVSIGGDKLQVRAIASEMPPWLGRISKYAGMAIALCQAIRGKGPLAGKLACFAMNFAINYAAGELVNGALKGSTRQISGRAGHPVHMPTGAKILDGDAELDFALEAPIPLVWQRFYSSLDARTDGLFGRGWSVPYMVELLLGQAGAYRVVWIDSQGRRTPVPDLQPGQRYHNRSEGLTFACTHGGHWMVEQDDGLCFDFGLPEPGSGSQILRPQVIEDRNANWLYLRYDVYGRLSELATMSGHLLTLEYDGRHARRVVRVLLHAAHATDCLAQYTYTEAGLLASVSDGEGHELRRFGYDEAGRMTMHRLPGGLTSFYRWEEFARTELAEENELQDREARVTENWTDEGEHYRFTYDFHSQATEVTDHLGRRQRCEWNGDYLVTAHTDALGHTWRFGWSKYRELVSVIEPDGAVTRMRYDDERGLPVRVTDALDRVMEMTWHPKWAELEQKTLPNGIRWTYEYDSRGNVVCEIDPLGQRTESRLGRYGYPQVLVDARGGITQFGWDARHRLSARTDCSGRTTRFAHDVRGRLTAVTDALGHTTRYCYDGRDRLLAVEQPDGGTERYQWTAGGAMEEVIDGNGHATRLAYDRAGRVTSRIDANGHRVTLEYDAAGNLRTLFNEKRDSYRFEYDAGDRLIEQTAPDGVRVEYQHNAAGLPLVVHQAVGTQEQITVVLRRDGLGRLVRKTTPETATAYHYDLAGQVERIERTDLHGVAMDSVALGYDALGRVVEETTVRMKDGGPLTSTLTHEYDALGNRLGTTLPGGHTLRWLYYGSGHLHQVSCDERVVCDLERDALHREIYRTQGALRLSTAYDSVSRKVANWVSQSVGGGAPSWDAFGRGYAQDGVKKAYRYDHAGELVARNDPLGGELGYRYDPAGRLVDATSSPVGMRWRDVSGVLNEQFAYDAASNLQPVNQPGLVEGNRLLMCRDKRFRYDVHGRLFEKRTGAHTVQHLAYNAEHQLIEVHTRRRDVEQTVRFSYDALGRRIEKQDAFGTTHFVWDGMRMVQEQRRYQVATYLYEPDSYVPLARIDAIDGSGYWLWRSHEEGQGRQVQADAVPEAKIYYFHANAAGAPEELTDSGGNVVWQTRYRAWGNTVMQEYVRAFEPSPAGEVMQPLPQPLRLQGQYEDLETGLHYNTFRYYDPDIGRFITPDPIGLAGGLNLYQYAPNPIGWIDPWGLSCGETEPKWKSRRSFKEGDSGLKNHAQRHSDLSPSQYLARGKQNVYDGQMLKGGGKSPDSRYYVRKIGDDAYSLTIASRKGEILSIDTWQHGGASMNQTTIVKGLERSGITAPKGFWESLQ